MATHYLTHNISVLGLLHTPITRPFQNVEAHDPRELSVAQLLIPLHRQHSHFKRVIVSTVCTTARQQH